MQEIPIYQKAMLTIEEASELTNIGRKKIEELMKNNECNFYLKNGVKTLIKREMFIDYLNKKSVI